MIGKILLICLYFGIGVANIVMAFSTPDSGIILDSISLIIGSLLIFIVAYSPLSNIYDTYCTKDDEVKGRH